MRKIIVFVLIILFFFGSSSYAVDWKHSIDSGLREARKRDKIVIVDFYTDWCGWCKKLDRDVFQTPAFDEAARDFVCVKINADNNKAAKEKYRVSSYPTVLFLDATGRVIHSIPGYVGAEAFIETMQAVLGHAKK